MNRHVLRAMTSVCALLLLWIVPSNAQTPDGEETVSVEVYNPSETAGKAFACPSNVPVGARAVEFKGEVSTTSESGVSYQVLIRYGTGEAPASKTQTGALRHENLETSHNQWNVSSNNGETFLELNATVVSGAPLTWRAELWGDSPGTVYHVWQTRLNNNVGQDETCTYEIVGVPDLAITIDRMHPNWVEDEAGKSGISAGNSTPQPGAFHFPVGETFDVNVIVENTGDDAMSYGLGASVGPLESGGPKLFEIESVEPSHGAALECQIGNLGDTFTCDGTNLASGERVEVNVTVGMLSTGSGAMSVGGAANGEQNFANNDDIVGLELIPKTGFGHIHTQKRVRSPSGGIGGGIEVPVDGVRFELLNPNEELLAFEDSGPMDIDESGDLDPDTERGVVWFRNLPPREYIVREVVEDNVVPFDPLGGSIVVVVNPGADILIGFTNDPKDGLDWGDLPEPYRPPLLPCPATSCFRTRGKSGASHITSNRIGIGFDVDRELDGRPSEFAFGDDFNGDDDEDGVFFDSLIAGSVGQITIDVFDSRDDRPHVAGWIDFDDNGMFSYRERIIDERRGDGLQTFTFPIPVGAVMKYGRFRVAFSFPAKPSDPQRQDAEDLASWGHYAVGEVEDYYIPPVSVDFGDAPEMMDPDRPDIPWGYPTTTGSDGAAHITVDQSDFRIGDRVDGDPVAQESIEADGDDYHNLYDEDGIRFAGGFVPFLTEPEPRSPDGVRVTYGFAPGSTVTVVPLANRDGKVDGWFDFNRNGGWQDPGEKVIDSVSVQSGPFFTPITFDVPESAVAGWTFARFRFSMKGGLDEFGQVEGGEVEDYLLRILPNVLRITTLEDGGTGSIRESIENANADGGTDPVYIVNEVNNGAGKTMATIVLESPLPEITRPVILSGGGSLVLDGSQAGDNANGLVLAGGSSGVHGVKIMNFSGHGMVISSDSNTVTDNVIVGNAGDGIRTEGSSANRLLSNVLTQNGGLAVDIGGDGPTANDPGDQDGIPNYPVITSVVRGSTTISGTLSSTAETTFLLQFFADDECTEGSRGVAGTLIGAGSVTTDVAGLGEFEIVLEQTLDKDVFVVAAATGPDGTSELSECGVQVTRIESDPVEVAPESFRLGANYPNPFASETTIPFDVPEANSVRIEIFNALGQLVNVPVDASFSPGRYRVTLDATTLPSGVYYYRMTTEQTVQTRKMIVLK